MQAHLNECKKREEAKGSRLLDERLLGRRRIVEKLLQRIWLGLQQLGGVSGACYCVGCASP